MRRREFLLGASGAAGVGAVAASSPAAAQESPTPTETGGGTETPGGGEGEGDGEGEGGDQAGAGAGATVEVSLVDYAFEPGTDEPLVIPPGTTVNFVWETDTHNIHLDSKPPDSDWQGHEPVENSGFEHSHTFEVTGDYHFWCVPHRNLGMVGDITVEEGAQVPGEAAGGAAGEVDPEEMGVPIQAHWVGTATILMIIVSLVFTFYLLKYGESPHSGYPKR